ncbi:MAG: alkaline shock response membrane anchor protein AmaP [Brevinematales bacterium]|nr:alkaline shock response membrane anchor protein AmaP [Brevinematales bacterium]
MTSRSKSRILNILMQLSWIVVVLVGVVCLFIAGRGSQLPVEQAIHFTTGMSPLAFLSVVGWILTLVGLGVAGWWYYEHFYSHTIYVRTPYGELEIHKTAIQGYLVQQLQLLPEVVDCDVSVAIFKRRFVALDIHVLLTYEKSCRDYGEKLQQDILQMLLSTFGIKDIKRFHLQVNAFLGGDSHKTVHYR